MNQDNLALVANPELARQITGANGQLPNLGSAVDAAIAQQQKAILDSVVADVVPVLEGLNAYITGKVNERAELTAKIASLDTDIAKGSTARAYFNETKNVFPAMKVIGYPIKPEVLKRSPNLDKVPDGWTPAAPAAAA